jgi:twitching motility protein PilI
MAAAQPDPFALLRRMAQESMRSAPGLPQETETRVLWSGVAFRLGELRLVAPLDHVREVLPYPSVTPVPNVKPWLKGVANVRGNLIAVADLAEYFGKPPVFANEDARLMILNHPGFNAGLLVDAVLGLRHFDVQLERREPPRPDDPVGAHLDGAFLRDGVRWGVFDMKSLAEAPSFRHAAAIQS